MCAAEARPGKHTRRYKGLNRVPLLLYIPVVRYVLQRQSRIECAFISTHLLASASYSLGHCKMMRRLLSGPEVSTITYIHRDSLRPWKSSDPAGGTVACIVVCNLDAGRRDAVTLRRLRIGHTRFSHSYLLNREDQPRCTYCDCALTVVHMLLECPHYSIVRQRYFSVTTLKDLFETVNTHTILDFIKEIGFDNRI